MAVKTDVVIVGGGLAGLTCAAALSGQGLEIVLLEEEQDVGGRLRGLVREGFRLDAGLHCFHYGDAGPLGDLNRSLELGLEFIDEHGSAYILEGKDRLPTPAEADTDPGEVPGFSPKQAARIREWFAGIMNADPVPERERSVADLLAESGFAEDKLVQAYASALCLSMLSRGPGEVSAGLLIEHSRAVGYPGFHVSSIAGGPGRLIESLAARIGRDRVKILLGSKVNEIEVEKKTARRVATSAEEFLPAAVVFAGPLPTLPLLFTGDRAPAGFTRLCRKTRPVAGVAIEFGLSSPICPIKGVLIDPEEMVIGRFPSNLDPSLAPAGAQISSWLTLVPPEDLQDVKATRVHIRRLKKVIRRQFPEMAEQVKWERLRVIPILSGAAPTPEQIAERRQPAAVKGINNLFLAGDAVAGKGLLSGAAVSSALEAAELVKSFLAGKAGKRKAEAAGNPEPEPGTSPRS